jgi:hypothetical protein
VDDLAVEDVDFAGMSAWEEMGCSRRVNRRTQAFSDPPLLLVLPPEGRALAVFLLLVVNDVQHTVLGALDVEVDVDTLVPVV